MRFLKAAVCLLMLAAAPVLFLQGLANAQIPPGPLFWNGFWQADVSRAFLQVEQEDGQIIFRVRDGGREFALDAFEREPLATDAFFLLAVGHREQGDYARMQQVVEAASALDRRNRSVGMLELEAATRQGDYREAFAVVDRLSVTHPRLIPEFVKVFADGLNQRQAVPYFEDALEGGPMWAEQFWGNVAITPQSASNVVALRGRTAEGTTPASDTRIIRGLVNAGMLEEAFSFWTTHFGDRSNPTLFLQTTEFEPIGWRAAESGDRTFSARGEGRFAIYVEDRTQGEVARQLVRLAPGAYRFTAAVEPATNAQALGAYLQCVEGNRPPLAAHTLDGAASWTIGAECPAYWLVLTGSAWESRVPLQSTISDMRFERLE